MHTSRAFLCIWLQLQMFKPYQVAFLSGTTLVFECPPNLLLVFLHQAESNWVTARKGRRMRKSEDSLHSQGHVLCTVSCGFPHSTALNGCLEEPHSTVRLGQESAFDQIRSTCWNQQLRGRLKSPSISYKLPTPSQKHCLVWQILASGGGKRKPVATSVLRWLLGFNQPMSWYCLTELNSSYSTCARLYTVVFLFPRKIQQATVWCQKELVT